MNEPAWKERFMLARWLGKDIDEVMDMPLEHYLCWREAYKLEHNGQ